MLQAYSQNAVEEMRDVMEKGGVESLATRGPPKGPAVSFVQSSTAVFEKTFLSSGFLLSFMTSFSQQA